MIIPHLRISNSYCQSVVHEKNTEPIKLVFEPVCRWNTVLYCCVRGLSLQDQKSPFCPFYSQVNFVGLLLTQQSARQSIYTSFSCRFLDVIFYRPCIRYILWVKFSKATFLILFPLFLELPRCLHASFMIFSTSATLPKIFFFICK